MCASDCPKSKSLATQDETVVGYDSDGSAVTFRHPAVQSGFMFAGELLCLIPYFLMKVRIPKFQI